MDGKHKGYQPFPYDDLPNTESFGAVSTQREPKPLVRVSYNNCNLELSPFQARALANDLQNNDTSVTIERCSLELSQTHAQLLANELYTALAWFSINGNQMVWSAKPDEEFYYFNTKGEAQIYRRQDDA